jgi:hypothetical protein
VWCCVVRRLGTMLFDFPSCCGVPLVHIEKSFSINDLDICVADPESLDILVTLILSYYFVGILLLYATNLDIVILVVNLSFLFLAMLNLYLHMMCSIDY